ncbi:MAG: ribonuclease P protein component [Bacilli bacterium]
MNHKYSLKKNHDIEKLIKLRQSVGNKYYAIYYSSSKNPLAQIALSPTKRFKTAVERNYEKRVLREILREQLDDLAFYKMLIVVKITAKELSFVQKKEQIDLLLNKIKKQNITEEKK